MLRIVYYNNKILISDFSYGEWHHDFEQFIDYDMDGNCMNYNYILNHKNISLMKKKILNDSDTIIEGIPKLCKHLSKFITKDNMDYVITHLNYIKQESNSILNILQVSQNSDYTFNYLYISIKKLSHGKNTEYSVDHKCFNFVLP